MGERGILVKARRGRINLDGVGAEVPNNLTPTPYLLCLRTSPSTCGGVARLQPERRHHRTSQSRFRGAIAFNLSPDLLIRKYKK